MRQGLIAQWRRGMATRGLVGSGLLALPVAAAVTIGFGGGFGGVAQGLSAVTGPSERSLGSAPPPPARGEEPLELAAAELAPPAGSTAGAEGGDSAGKQEAGGQEQGESPGAPSPPGAGGDPGGAIGGAGEVGEVGGGGSSSGGGGLGLDLPPGGGGGGGGGAGAAVGGVVDGVGQTVDGVLGGGK